VITFLKVKAIFSKFHLYISIKNQNSEKKVSKALHAFETFFNGLKITKLQGYKVTRLLRVDITISNENCGVNT
jgi:hypothetical protein